MKKNGILIVQCYPLHGNIFFPCGFRPTNVSSQPYSRRDRSLITLQVYHTVHGLYVTKLLFSTVYIHSLHFTDWVTNPVCTLNFENNANRTCKGYHGSTLIYSCRILNEMQYKTAKMVNVLKPQDHPRRERLFPGNFHHVLCFGTDWFVEALCKR